MATFPSDLNDPMMYKVMTQGDLAEQVGSTDWLGNYYISENKCARIFDALASSVIDTIPDAYSNPNQLMSFMTLYKMMIGTVGVLEIWMEQLPSNYINWIQYGAEVEILWGDDIQENHTLIGTQSDPSIGLRSEFPMNSTVNVTVRGKLGAENLPLKWISIPSGGTPSANSDYTELYCNIPITDNKILVFGAQTP